VARAFAVGLPHSFPGVSADPKAMRRLLAVLNANSIHEGNLFHRWLLAKLEELGEAPAA
jgi:hypothetical protein